ncbi:MAG: hypothetical protein Kow0031_10040 [Anaerolineae bacterium]
MKIRSIAQFVPLHWPFENGDIASAARLLADAAHRFRDAGFEVQHTCLATPPFLDVLAFPDEKLLLEFAKKLDDLARQYHIDQVSIGPLVATTPLALLSPINALPRVIAETEKIHSGVLFADKYSGVNLAAAHAFAQTICQVAQSSGAAANLRLAALANVPPFLPFAPAAYQQGGLPGFSVAAGAADVALAAVRGTRTITEAHKRLVMAIQNAGKQLLNVANELVDDHNVAFQGLDFSLTPSPEQGQSIGEAIEELGVDAFGGGGTLFALSFLTNAVREADMPHLGFSGVQLPILRDELIARRAEEGRFSVNDLLLYSAISNSGLDMIPIPGNTQPEEIAAVYLDMAALALYSGKPLSARLLPIPGKAVGQKIDLQQPGLTGSRVLPMKNLGAHQLFEDNSFLSLSSVIHRSRGKTGGLSAPSR